MPPPLNRLAVWRHTMHYAGATYLCRALTALRGLINARCLGPQLYGFWGSLTLILSFGFYLHGGIQDAAARAIPMDRSRGREDLACAAAQLAWTVFAGVLAIATLVLWTVAWRLPANTTPLVRVGWVVAGAALPLEVLWLFEQVIARAEERFTHVSRSLLLSSAISLGLTCWWVVSYGLAGLFAVSILTPAIGLWYLRRRARYPWRLRWSWAQVRSMVAVGWPILAMTLVFEALGWIDRVIVLGVAGVVGFGYYSLAAMLAQLCGLFPSVMAAVVEPRLYADYARRQRADEVRDHVWFPLRTLAFLMPVGFAVLDLLVPALVGRWLPSYTPGLVALRVLIWGSVFLGLAVCTKSFIVALGKQREALPVYGIAIATNVVASAAFASCGWGLGGIAWGTLLAYGVCASGLLRMVFRHLGESAQEIRARFVMLYWPLAVVSGLTILMPWLVVHVVPQWMSAGPGLRLGGAVGSGAIVLWQMRRQRPLTSIGAHESGGEALDASNPTWLREVLT
ncbi:MAG: polysaccharide biosynthesis C-terminal domain-containing protein [Candidatus Omnitrophica bacterium]|nr:polysaccharide biosynthesis C-terminal domain-containing protein [Candidatus Omnitrophota bacterium]